MINKELLLQVADDVENDALYDGKQWVTDGNECGCAMIRTMVAAGGKLNLKEKVSLITGSKFDYIELPNWGDEGRLEYGFEVRDGFGKITGIDNPWTLERFQVFTCKADAQQTARALRELAETGDFTNEN